MRRLNLLEVARPVMKALAVLSGESVHVAILDRDEMLYVEWVSSSQSVQTFSRVGYRVPLYCSALGKAVLAFLPPQEQEGLLKTIKFTRHTPDTIMSRDDLLSDLSLVRQRGYATHDEEVELGIRTVAAPIRNHTGTVFAAISVAGPTLRIDREQLPALGGYAREAADKISTGLGWEPDLSRPAETT